MNAAAVTHYPYTKWLIIAGVLGLVGQLSGVLFMLDAGPYTTILFIGAGLGFILLAMLIFALVWIKDAQRRANSISPKTYAAGETIFREGDPGDKIYIVKSGEVEIVRQDKEKGETIVARLRDGEYFGEMALLTNAPRNASARAGAKTEVLTIEREDFQSLFSGIPAFRASVESAMSKRS